MTDIPDDDLMAAVRRSAVDAGAELTSSEQTRVRALIETTAECASLGTNDYDH